MNPTADDATAKPSPAPAGGNGKIFPGAAPRPAAPAPAPPRKSRSTLKLMIPVIALVGVVFGITFFAQYTPPSDEGLQGTKEGNANEPPLRFFTSARTYDPPSFLPPSRFQPLNYKGLPLLAPSARPLDSDFPFRFSLQDRAFAAFYEPKDDLGLGHSTTFWFENPHQKPVAMALRYVSCGSCTGGRVAPIPPDVARQLLQMSRISILPQGLATGLPVGMVGPAANLDEPRLTWERHVFRENPNATYKVPAAGENPDGWTPQWGILRLDFSVGAVGAKPLRIDFSVAVEGSQEAAENKFLIVPEGMNAFELTRPFIDLGDLTDRSEARKFEIIAFSATRGPNRTGPGQVGDFAPPKAFVRMPTSQGGDPGKFIQISEPERIPDSELGQVMDLLTEMSQRQKFFRVEAAYRYTVTYDSKSDNRSIDIGLLEREIWFTLDGSDQRQVQVRGMVSGSVWLDNNQNLINMPNVAQSEGFVKTFRLVTARRDLEIGLLEKETKPAFLKVSLVKDPSPPAVDRGFYMLSVRVQSSKENSSVRPGTWSGEVVLEVKGERAQRIRIPIKGRITLN